MTRSRAIKLYCLECGGGHAKEVTLCVIGDCPLYPFRFGNSPESGAYKKRMARAIENYPAEWAEIVKDCPLVGLPCKSKPSRRAIQRGSGADTRNPITEGGKRRCLIHGNWL